MRTLMPFSVTSKPKTEGLRNGREQDGKTSCDTLICEFPEAEEQVGVGSRLGSVGWSSLIRGRSTLGPCLSWLPSTA